MPVKPYLQLVRLPNVFTAAADSLAGWLLVTGTFQNPGRWLPLVLASACTYAGGIVLNDVMDFDVDLIERPNRPLPSGQIGRRLAAALAILLMAAGLALAIVAGTMHGWIVELALLGGVLLYDMGLKRSALGPEVMGACRGLNLLLGTSEAAGLGGPTAWGVAVAYGAFVAGITWISRAEVHAGVWKPIAAGLTLQIAAFIGLLVACARADTFPRPELYQGFRIISGMVVLGVIGDAVVLRTVRAVRDPVPETIQRAVKFGILALVGIHVGLLLGVRGWAPAVAVGLLWFPARWSGRWIYST